MAGRGKGHSAFRIVSEGVEGRGREREGGREWSGAADVPPEIENNTNALWTVDQDADEPERAATRSAVTASQSITRADKEGLFDGCDGHRRPNNAEGIKISRQFEVAKKGRGNQQKINQSR